MRPTDDNGYIPTVLGQDSKGDFLFLDGRLAWWPIGLWAPGLLMYVVTWRQFGLLGGLIWFVPGLLVLAVILLFINRKPPGNFTDWIDQHLLGKGNATCGPKKQSRKP